MILAVECWRQFWGHSWMWKDLHLGCTIPACEQHIDGTTLYASCGGSYIDSGSFMEFGGRHWKWWTWPLVLYLSSIVTFSSMDFTYWGIQGCASLLKSTFLLRFINRKPLATFARCLTTSWSPSKVYTCAGAYRRNKIRSERRREVEVKGLTLTRVSSRSI